jgi:putative ABC transport system permease protein
MMIAFGIIALLLAAGGIYAVMSYSVSQRTHEIGVRMALGARPADVLKMIIAYTLKLAAIGIGIGLPLAFAMSRALASAMLGVFQTDAAMFIAFPLVLGATALIAGLVPARWATRVDPMIALRSE